MSNHLKATTNQPDKSESPINKQLITIILIIFIITICAFLAGSLITNQIKTSPSITKISITQLAITQISTQLAITQISPTQLPTYTNPPPTIIIVTATPQPIPTNTPIINTNTPIPDPLYGDHNPGIWRNNGNSEKCYWAIKDRTGKILDNFFGYTGGTIYIPPDEYEVELDKECGTWTYIEPP